MATIVERLVEQRKGTVDSYSKSYTVSEGEEGGSISDGCIVTENPQFSVASQQTTLLERPLKNNIPI